eukprot:gene15304-21389_t
MLNDSSEGIELLLRVIRPLSVAAGVGRGTSPSMGPPPAPGDHGVGVASGTGRGALPHTPMGSPLNAAGRSPPTAAGHSPQLAHGCGGGGLRHSKDGYVSPIPSPTAPLGGKAQLVHKTPARLVDAIVCELWRDGVLDVLLSARHAGQDIQRCLDVLTTTAETALRSPYPVLAKSTLAFLEACLSPLEPIDLFNGEPVPQVTLSPALHFAVSDMTSMVMEAPGVGSQMADLGTSVLGTSGGPPGFPVAPEDLERATGVKRKAKDPFVASQTEYARIPPVGSASKGGPGAGTGGAGGGQAGSGQKPRVGGRAKRRRATGLCTYTTLDASQAEIRYLWGSEDTDSSPGEDPHPQAAAYGPGVLRPAEAPAVHVPAHRPAVQVLVHEPAQQPAVQLPAQRPAVQLSVHVPAHQPDVKGPAQMPAQRQDIQGRAQGPDVHVPAHWQDVQGLAQRQDMQVTAKRLSTMHESSSAGGGAAAGAWDAAAVGAGTQGGDSRLSSLQGSITTVKIGSLETVRVGSLETVDFGSGDVFDLEVEPTQKLMDGIARSHARGLYVSGIMGVDGSKRGRLSLTPPRSTPSDSSGAGIHASLPDPSRPGAKSSRMIALSGPGTEPASGPVQVLALSRAASGPASEPARVLALSGPCTRPGTGPIQVLALSGPASGPSFVPSSEPAQVLALSGPGARPGTGPGTDPSHVSHPPGPTTTPSRMSHPSQPGTTPCRVSDPSGQATAPSRLSDPSGAYPSRGPDPSQPGTTPCRVQDTSGQATAPSRLSDPSGLGACPSRLSDPSGLGACPSRVSDPSQPGTTPAQVVHPSGQATNPYGGAYPSSSDACPLRVSDPSQPGTIPAQVVHPSGPDTDPSGVPYPSGPSPSTSGTRETAKTATRALETALGSAAQQGPSTSKASLENSNEQAPIPEEAPKACLTACLPGKLLEQLETVCMSQAWSEMKVSDLLAAHDEALSILQIINKELKERHK